MTAQLGLLGEEVRVLPPRPVDRREGAQHQVPHPGRRRRRREVQRADRLQLVRVGGVAAGGREEGRVEDGVDLLLLVPAVGFIYQWAFENPGPKT